MTTIWQALETWGKSLTPWQRFILEHTIHKGQVETEQVDKAYALFLKEQALTDEEPDAPSPPVLERPAAALPERPVLARLSDIHAVNALRDDAELTFGPELTVIYGRNGAGKSGFGRLLANACFSRYKPQILPDIYAVPGNATVATATFTISIAGAEQAPIIFPENSVGSPLERISVFDSNVAKAHLTETAAFEFKPAGFDVFPEMVRIYGLLSDRLGAEIENKSTSQSFAQSFLGEGTDVHKAVAALETSNDLTKIRHLAVFGPTESARIDAIGEQLLALRTQNPKDLQKTLTEARDDVRHLREQLETSATSFNETSHAKRVALADEAKTTANAASALGTDQFKRPFFSAVASPEWDRFIQSFHDLSEVETASDRCLLCERSLDETSRAHVEALFAFAEGVARTTAMEARKSLQRECEALRSLRLSIFDDGARVRAHVVRLSPEVAKVISQFVELLKTQQQAALDILDGAAASYEKLDAAPLQQLAELEQQIAADIRRVETDKVEDAIATLEKERSNLRHRQVLLQLLPSIETWVAGRIWVAKASAARAQLNTRHVTDKEKELFKSVVGDGYRNRLEAECEALDCKLPVELQTVGRGGQTVRSLAMKGGHRPDQILSEGEQRAIALADFLTEVHLNPASAGIVLDDPVTSLDEQRKNRIARRLVEESGPRQVVVLTHDLVFLNMLFTAADEMNRKIESHWIERDLDGRPGQVALGDAPLTSKKYQDTQRAQEALTDAKKKAGAARQEAILKGMGALRTTLEEMVVRRVFKEAVPRWSDQVRVTTLRKVNWDNARIEEICELYEDLSRYIEGHSHTDEGSGSPPAVTDLEQRIEKVKELLKWSKPDRPKS